MARRAEARAPVVAGADLWLAEAAIPCRPRHASISRNDLSESLYPDTRRAEEGADGAAAYNAADAPSQRRHHQERTGTDRRCGFHPRAAGRGRRSRRARPLGRRPSLRSKQHPHRDAGRAAYALCDASQSPEQDTASVVAALGKHVRKLPQELRRSLTWDRGKEMADHKNFTVATNVQVYFCDPRSPWQRGSNENTNGLLRQYFPRGTDLSRFSQAYLNRIALRLNQRPRKTLGFETPADRLRAVLQ